MQGAAIVADRFGLRGENSYYRDEDDNQEADFSDGLEDMEEERDVDAGVERPSPCSFLLPGRSFIGQQRLSSSRRQQEDWAVTATIYSCDLARGRVTGSMVAQNSPAAKRPIVTFFEVRNRQWRAHSSSGLRLKQFGIDPHCCPHFPSLVDACLGRLGSVAESAIVVANSPLVVGIFVCSPRVLSC